MAAEKFIQALAVAWNGVQLYPDPISVPSFVQAVEAIGAVAADPVVLNVGVDGFEVGGEVVPVANRAADRLVQALFAQRVESLEVAAAPDPEEVIEFFALLEEGNGDLDLDFPARLQLAGSAAIRVRCHELLEDREEDNTAGPEDVVDRHPDVQALFEQTSISTMADRFMSADSPDSAASEFVDLYRSSYGRVDRGDATGLERVVQTFVDAFFRLDRDYRAVIFEAVVAARDEEPFRNFLDQLSADELAELGGEVTDSALPLLIEYARVVGEMQGRDPGLVERVMGEREADTRGAVAGMVGMQLASFVKLDATSAGPVALVAEEVAGLQDGPQVGFGILTDLFGLEHRTERVARLLRIWVAKVGGAIQAKDFRSAASWLEVIDGATVDKQLLDGAYYEAATDDVLAVLTAPGDSDRAERAVLFEKLSRRAGARVIEQLATEEDPGRRRMLIDIVTEIARVDIGSVLPGLTDPRWYVVRNVATALGKSGRKAAGEPLARTARHDDHRVRIEALRSLVPCLGNGALDHLVGALADDHVRVRAAASALLSSLEDELVVPALNSALLNETLSVDVRVAVIETLGRRTTESALTALRTVAGSKARFSSSARTIRSAARQALRSGHG